MSLFSRNIVYAEAQAQDEKPGNFWQAPSRQEMLNRLKGLDKDGKPVEDNEFDLLIVGGGATGTGTAVDAATRGLKVAIVERDDFASGSYILLNLLTFERHVGRLISSCTN